MLKLAAIAAVLLILKLGFAAILMEGYPSVFQQGDTSRYVTVAEALFVTGDFNRSIDNPVPETVRLPGYPAFLYPFQFLDKSYRYQVVSMVQITIQVIWLFAVGCLILRRFGFTAAVVFVVFLSIHPVFNHYGAAIHSDFLYALFFCSGFFLLFLSIEGGTAVDTSLIFAFLSFLVAQLVRPDGMLLPYFLFAMAAVMTVKGIRAGGVMSHGTSKVWVFSLGGLIPIFAWSTRNYTVAGLYSYTSQTPDVLPRILKLLNLDRESGAFISEGMLTSAWNFLLIGLQSFEKLFDQGVVVLFNLFLNPGRWYYHTYVESLGVSPAGQAVPWELLKISNLDVSEILYIAYSSGIGVLSVTFFAFSVARNLFSKYRLLDASALTVLLVPVTYLLAVQFIWNGGLRFQLPMLPIMVFLGVMVFARRDAAQQSAPTASSD